ncbi:sugar-binding transcriptional regulator [soil metagenome]
MPDDALSLVPVDHDQQVATRAAWLYFVAGLTQIEISRELGINRVRVNRLLADAREQGIVQIRITGRLANCVELEEKLKSRFGLTQAIVVPTPPNPALIPIIIGAATGRLLDEKLKDGMAVGVGWGRTLRLSLRSMRRRPLRKVSVVSLMGGLTRGSAVNPYETASHLADLIDAQCYYIAAPALADSEATRDLLFQQSMIKSVFDRLQRLDLVLVSVGGLSPESTICQVDLVSREDADSLMNAGAAGDVCVHWIDEAGNIVDHPLNRRAIALSPEHLKSVPCVIVASGGADKIGALHGALQAGIPDILITDEATAAAVLARTGAKPAAASMPIERKRRSL